jgi:hypothetical protein
MNTHSTHDRPALLTGLFVALALLCGAGQAAAQWSMQALPPPSVLHPPPSMWWIGPQVGINAASHSGTFYTSYCECEFSDGSGTGLTLGVEVGRRLSPVLNVALKLLYNDLRAEYSYPIRLLAYEVISEEYVEADHERHNDVRLGYVMLHPVLQFQPLPFLYFFAGPAVGIRTTATQLYTLRLTDPQFVMEFGDSNERVIEEDSGDIPDSQAIRADLRAGIGLNFRLGRTIRLAPELSYGVPLTTISDVDGWKASALHAVAVLKIDL